MSHKSKQAATPRETRTYTVEGRGEALGKLEKVMLAFRSLGSMGASRQVFVFFDGDGSDKLTVEELSASKLSFEGRDYESNEINLDKARIVSDLPSRVASRWMARRGSSK